MTDAMTLEDKMAYVGVKLGHLAAEHDRDLYLRSLVELCASAVEAERCTFYLVDHERGELRAKAGWLPQAMQPEDAVFLEMKAGAAEERCQALAPGRECGPAGQ